MKTINENGPNLRPFCFVKFGPKKYMEELHFEGLLYCNSMHYFASLEGERGDNLETAYNLKVETVDAEILLDGSPIQNLSPLIMQTAIRRSEDSSCGKIFCLSNLNLSEIKEGVHPLTLNNIFKNDSEYCVVIYNVKIFHERLHQKLESLGIEHERDYIKYFNPMEFQGNKTKFMKPNKFEHEREFRIWFDEHSSTPLQINIELKDISFLMKSDDQLLSKKVFYRG